MEEWGLQVDSIAAFLEDEDWVVPILGEKVERTELYGAYRNWCKGNSYHSVSRNKFYKRLEKYSHGEITHNLFKSNDWYFENLLLNKSEFLN